jgi:DNA-binding transcriptional LysR family regulator
MNIHRVDYRLLRSFFVVARTENFVLASEALNISQSALSQQMKELASHFNSAIFERKGRRSVLSEFGRDLLNKLEPLMGQMDEALLQSMYDDKQIVGALRIGSTHAYSKAIALPASLRLLKKYPELRIDLRELSTQRLIADLMHGDVDVAIVPEDHQLVEFYQQPLLTEQFALIGKPNSMVHFPKKLTITSFKNTELALVSRQFLMRQQIEMEARRENIQLNVRLEVTTMGDLLDIARTGSFTVIGSPIACWRDEELISRPVSGEFLKRTAALCWRKGRFVTGAMKAFQETAIEISADLRK